MAAHDHQLDLSAPGFGPAPNRESCFEAPAEVSAQPQVRLHRHRAMGTEFWLYLVDTGDAGEERTLAQAVWAEVDRVEATFSRFRESSEIARLNRLAALGPVVTDPEVFFLLLDGRRIWEKTGGAFDIALGRLSRAWGFAEKAPRMPTAEARAAAEAASGMALVELDAEWRTVAFLREGVELDLGAFAKGYAVDCALAVLRGAGAAGLVNAGRSSIGAVGEPFESGWTVEVKTPVGFDRSCPGGKSKDAARIHPTDEDLPVETPRAGQTEDLKAVALHGRALGSSGIMEQNFEAGGRVYAHVYDPRKPGERTAEARQMLQVTVLARTAALADALSTALFVLGPDEGAVVAGRFEDCAALWMYRETAGVGTRSWNWPQERR